MIKIRNVIKKRESGMANAPICLLCVFFVMIAFFFVISGKSLNMTKNKIDDSLTSSGLSAMIADMDKYTATGDLKLHPEKAYEAFVSTLKVNLDLNNNMEANNPSYYKKIDVLSFTIYNVSGSDVEVLKCQNGIFAKTVYPGQLGKLKAENGKTIETSSLYIELGIAYDVFMLQNERYGKVSNLLAVNFNEQTETEDN